MILSRQLVGAFRVWRFKLERSVDRDAQKRARGAGEGIKKSESGDFGHLLHNGVIGVLTGLTRTLSWVICRAKTRLEMARHGSTQAMDTVEGVAAAQNGDSPPRESWRQGESIQAQ